MAITEASPSVALAAELERAFDLAKERMRRGPPAFERFPSQALRYRDYGTETRHARGDAYPLYTLDTLRNLADHLFDWTTGYESGPSRAARVQACDLVYSTLRPNGAFAQKVHRHIKVPYLLVTDTADVSVIGCDELRPPDVGSGRNSFGWRGGDDGDRNDSAVGRRMQQQRRRQQQQQRIQQRMQQQPSLPDQPMKKHRQQQQRPQLLQQQPAMGMDQAEQEADERGCWPNAMLREPTTLYRWWAVDSEVVHPRVEPVPLGVTDNLEPPGKRRDASTVVFHANLTRYVHTLRRAQAQPKRRWLMMQMGDTHPERRRVRRWALRGGWHGEDDVQLTPERRVPRHGGSLGTRQFLQEMGQHRFVLSPRGNGLDAHRTWEALLVGAIPIVRHSALHPLYERLPVLVVADWPEVTPRLLRDFYANYSARREMYDYERLFADHWFERIGAQRARCTAERMAQGLPVGDGGATSGNLFTPSGERVEAHARGVLSRLRAFTARGGEG